MKVKVMQRAQSLLAAVAVLAVASSLSAAAAASQDQTNNNNTTTTSENATVATTGGHLVETLAERLVKQSNLIAEESQESGARVVAAPAGFKRQQDERIISKASGYSGGSGNSYMALAHDGSNRYQFGYDTHQQQQVEGNVKQARLMREESRLEDGTVIGRYGYTDPFNVFRIVQYVAGPDGYFASEDVGQVEQMRAGNKFQLNRQLRRALEQARAKRMSRAASSQQHEEPLTSSASGLVRFATQINHIIGSNGRSYSTAFRPTIIRPTQYEPVKQQQQPLGDRSKLPAPIYTPSSFNFLVDHSASTSPSQAPFPQDFKSNGGLEEGAAESQRQSQHPWQAPASAVLESSPAWSVLSNTYSSPLGLIIDHNGGSSSHFQLPSTPVGQDFQADFGRQSALLASLQHSPAASSTPVYSDSSAASSDQHAQQQQPPPPPLSPPAGAESSSGRNLEFGRRNLIADLGHQALKHFDPPLYHPAVHETPVVVEKPVAVYASTILHSEVAAERDYRPERLRVVGSEPLQVAATASLEAQEASGKEIEEPVRYATRLSSRQSSLAPSDGDLYVEASEQQSTNANGTTTTTTSRAKLPANRAKKLSNIFKSRTDAAGEAANSAQAKIRRPIPVNLRGSTQQQPTVSPPPPPPSPSTEATELPLLNPHHSEPKPVKFAASKKFGKLEKAQQQQPISVIVEPIEVESPSISVAAAKKRPILRSEPTLFPLGNAAAASQPPKASSNAADKLQATVIDVDDEMKSALDKDLYEKIVKIQREIAAKSLLTSTTTSTTTQVPTTSTTTTKASQLETTTLLPVSTPPPTTTTTTTTTTTELPTTTSTTTTTMPTPTTTTSTSTTTTTMTPTTTVTLDTSVAPQTQGANNHNSIVVEVQEGPSDAAAARPTIPSEAGLITGKLMPMDSTLLAENGEFMADLEKTSSFDSARTPSDSTTTTTTTRPLEQTTTTTSSPASESSSLPEAKEPPTTTTGAQLIAAKQPAAEATTFEPLVLVASSSVVPFGDSPTSTPQSSSTSTSTIASTTTTTTTTLAPEPSTTVAATTTSTAPTTTTTTTERATTTSTSTRAPTTTTTTSTTTAKPTRRTTFQPRFGRLVIKRGDKVVARFNASDPIPDSMIPIANGNSSDIIVPDLPRSGLRRSIKRKVGFSASRLATSTAAPTNLTTTTTTTTTTSTTTAPTTTTTTTTSPTSVTPTSNSSRQAGSDPLVAEASEWSSAKPKRLFGRRREPRSSSSSLFVDDLIAAETSSIEDDDDEDRELRAIVPLVTSINQTAIAQTSTTTTPRPRSAPISAASWSARLRDAAPATSNKRYDPKEDLRKMVDKISALEVGSRGPRLSRPSKVEVAPVISANNATTGKPASLELVRLQRESMSTVAPPQTNGTSTRSKNTTVDLQDTSTNNNKTTTIIAEPLAQKSITSSAVFTVPISPKLEEKWQQLRPIQTNGSAPTIQANGEARVDSHGHIHVRNNQSVTVHVDIEPPRRSPPPLAKRLISRDTQAASNQLRASDSMRLEAVANSTQQQQQVVSTQPRNNNNQTQPQPPQRRRAPRMLCIEVDNQAAGN